MADATHLRSWWAKKQGLDGSPTGATPGEVLQQSGWARSVGGVNPYLTLFSRAEISRETADQAVVDLQIYELPSARGCTYVVPSCDFPLALKIGQNFGDEADIQKAIKYLGVTQKEIDRLMHRILNVLESGGAKDPRQLKEALGDAVRNFGEEGKKRGVTTTLPLALGTLQSLGQIRRVPLNGRLDQQRYAYVNWSPSPLEKWKTGKEEAYTLLAERFFRWIGPAALQDFQWFSGLSLKASKAAVEPLKLEPIENESSFFILPDEMDSFQNFKPPKQAQYCLVSSLDGISQHRRDLAVLLDEKDAKRRVHENGGSSKPLGYLHDLPSRAILDRGRLVGLWEFEPSSGAIVWQSFIPRDKQLEKAVAKMQDFIRNDLGDARSFSLDSPVSRAPRIASLRKG